MNAALLSSRGEKRHHILLLQLQSLSGVKVVKKSQRQGLMVLPALFSRWKTDCMLRWSNMGWGCTGRAVVQEPTTSCTQTCQTLVLAVAKTHLAETQWNWASTYWLWKRLNTKRSCLCSQRTLSCCWNAVLRPILWTSTDWIFSGVICLTLDPVAQSDWHGPSGKDFWLTKPHCQSSQQHFSPFTTLGTWALLHQQEPQPRPCPPLQTIKFMLLTGLVVQFQLAKAAQGNLQMLQSSNRTSGKTGKQHLPKPSSTSLCLWNSFSFEQMIWRSPPKPQLSYGSGKKQQNAISLSQKEVSMESYSYRHKGSSGTFSPSAVRWGTPWGDELSRVTDEQKEVQILCKAWLRVSVRVLESNPSNSRYSSE